MSEWEEKPAALAALLDEARADVPEPARLDRVRARLEADLGVPLVPRAKAPGVSPTLVVGGVVVIAVVVWLLLRGRETVAVTEPVAEAAAVTETVTETETETVTVAETEAETETEAVAETETEAVAETEAEPVAEPEAVTATVTVAEAEAVVEVVADDESDDGSTLREEIALLERAMAARDRGDVGEARSVLSTHEARFPSGVLRPERERLLRELDGEPAPADPARGP